MYGKNTQVLITDHVRLAKPAQRALLQANITTFQELSNCSEQEIAELHCIGKNALDTLKSAMLKMHISFKQ